MAIAYLIEPDRIACTVQLHTNKHKNPVRPHALMAPRCLWPKASLYALTSCSRRTGRRCVYEREREIGGPERAEPTIKQPRQGKTSKCQRLISMMPALALVAVRELLLVPYNPHVLFVELQHLLALLVSPVSSPASRVSGHRWAGWGWWVLLTFCGHFL